MEKVTQIEGEAAFLPIDNIDTDMIIPKNYLKTIKRTGLGRWLFAEMRYDASGTARSDFILNQKPETKILLAGENFGCGSSREHAPWSLLDFGIRAVIAPGFADIFYNNSFKNGLLPIKLEKAAIEKLAAFAGPVRIDLAAQTVSAGADSFIFAIEANNKQTLLEGLDAIAKVLQMEADIKSFERKRMAEEPWIQTSGEGSVYA